MLAERATSQDPAPASLLDLLSEYPEIKRPEWRRLLGSCFSRGAFSRPFRIDQREEYFRSASRAAIDKNIKLVVAETFYGGNGMSGQYARLALCSVPVDPASDPKLLPLNLRRVNNEQSWDDLLKCCGPLLESHAPIGPEKRIFDAIDALVISYFDGQHWKSRAWIDVLAQIDMSGAKRLGDLTAEQRAALELMQLIKSRINVPDFPGEYDVFLSALYKTPENENRR